jgi:hypothetical protein
MPPQDYPADWNELVVDPQTGSLSPSDVQLLHQSLGLLINMYNKDGRYDKYSIKYLRFQHKKTTPPIADDNNSMVEVQRLRVWRHKTQDMAAFFFLRTRGIDTAGNIVKPGYCMAVAVDTISPGFDVAAALMQVCIWTAKHVPPKRVIDILSEYDPTANPQVPPTPNDGGTIDGVFAAAIQSGLVVLYPNQVNASSNPPPNLNNADAWPKPLNRWTVTT